MKITYKKSLKSLYINDEFILNGYHGKDKKIYDAIVYLLDKITQLNKNEKDIINTFIKI